jgi:ribose transport system substrate-binding protein
VDRGLTDTSAQDAYAAGDNKAFGRLASIWPGIRAGRYRCHPWHPTTIDNERVRLRPVIKKYRISDPDAKHGNWNRDDAFKVMQDYLTHFKHIDAVRPL